MHRHSITLCVILLLLMAAGGWLWQKEEWEPMSAEGQKSLIADVPAIPEATSPAEPVMQAQEKNTPSLAPEEVSLDPSRFRRAYRMMLDNGMLTLEEATDVEGEFVSPRAKPEEWAGMLRCRLLDSAGKVLAEEVMPAPDYLCTVLDSHRGEAKPVQLAVPGPAVFQVRLPRVARAVRLDVARITGAGSFKRDQPVGSIALNSP